MSIGFSLTSADLPRFAAVVISYFMAPLKKLLLSHNLAIFLLCAQYPWREVGDAILSYHIDNSV
ncbi:hypothetical protein LAZ67_1006608 [Cordylochernes scorpioides]|uniref:Uncharacterized protein n=1 Tax=Cordylochernes scorpioides TaxID=51811 RepID=A0ABY6K0H3_9ARAC|nr:hypothetical protein LAZ67_1006608 [Cordylochernes scorpioides]